MDVQWTKSAQVCNDQNLPLSPISAIAFDPYQELVWTGNDQGHIGSYYGTNLQKYTNFKGHDEQVRQLCVIDRGLISLSPKRVRLTHRRGIVKWALSSDDTKDLHCFTQSSHTNSEIIVGGQQDHMLTVNLHRGIVTKKIDSGDPLVVMRQSRLLCCGSATGNVILRDPRSLKIEHRVQAHTGALSDLGVMGNYLLTCGFSHRQDTLIIDPLVKIYDLRTMRTLAPLPFPSGPCFLAMHPRLSATVFIVSQTGQFQMCDVGNPSASLKFYQLPTTSYITAMDISSSGELLTFGDAGSFVHLWKVSDDAKPNNFSSPLELPEPVPPRPNTHVGEDSPFSLIGLPYYRDPLLSTFPPNITFEVGKAAPEIDSQVLAHMKTIDFVGYAPNPGTHRRNQVPTKSNASQSRMEVPKFRSEQAKELYFGNSGASADPLFFDEVAGPTDVSGLTMPKYYRRVEIKYSRFGIEDFDFGFYNKTAYGGLETHIANSYCNGLLQLLFFTPALREVTKWHIATPCPKENCLTCELGFLFRMLEDSRGQNCQATNFLRAFSTIPQASALGLFEPEEPDIATPYGLLIQNFNRFLLERMHQELNLPPSPEIVTCAGDVAGLSPIQQLFGPKIRTWSRCLQCGHEMSRETWPFVVDLVYPTNIPKAFAGPGGKPSAARSFAEILQSSLQRETQTKAWCNNCKNYQLTNAQKRTQNLPPLLPINCAATTREQLEIWRGERELPEGEGGEKRTRPWLPKRICLARRKEVLVVEERAEETGDAEGEEKAVYELTGVVAQIQGGKEIPHLVSLIKVPDSELTPDSESPWYLFNDFLVKNVSEMEPVNFKGAWKTPSVLFYTRVDVSDIMDMSSLQAPLDPSILLSDINISKNRDASGITHTLLTADEIPERGKLVAIDAEFVVLNQEETEIRSDGTKSVLRPSRFSLARVSVLRGEGEKEGLPFIDDYIAASEPVVDYLTEFSGIMLGDLDPGSSKHTLVPLKAAYKKLRLLVDLGCIFVGHGLNKDFRTINILVPPEQIIDTVDIYRIPNRQRKISLRFLAWCLLGADIQQDMHDSIEDAKTALLIYRKYLDYRAAGIFGEVLEDVYDVGKRTNWKPVPGTVPDMPSVSAWEMRARQKVAAPGEAVALSPEAAAPATETMEEGPE
ncbi:uncharacterized protein VTP21DRAFT_9426 [Calcarisporiella thermophila]|uniref:uncharacterized protein n=1 Tax=Calcarisporiella thermophila TaxID=911321 RepID=UPI0037441108